MKVFMVLFLVIAIYCCSCKSKEMATATTQMQQKKALTKADKILFETFEAHGGEKYHTAHYGFVFRNKKYTFQNNHPAYTYTVSYEKDGKKNLNQLSNDGLLRTVDGEKAELSEKAYNGYVGALNSVIYFATLPHKLYDPAVNKFYQGETVIKGKKYDILEITFNEEGGGPDHDDKYYYWINQETHRIDYLAYNYLVNNGGVRFRSAYNPRVVDGILFQDYINYKADVGTPLADLPALFEQGTLKQLSVIETEDVVNLK